MLLLAVTAGLAAAVLLPAVLLPGTSAASAAAIALHSSSAAAPTGTVIPGTHCTSFPANNYWNTDIRKLQVDKHSKQWLSHMQVNTRHLHADFGPSFGAQPVPYGIPVTIVTGAPKVKVLFTYASESDRVGYPLNSRTKIEGGSQSGGDRHAIVVDAKTCTLYETWNTRDSGNRWTAGSGAVWSLRSNALRPAGWTSADAAGLPILPGLLQFNEVRSGKVMHAIRFTTNITNRADIWPARHQAGAVRNAAYPPMGARFRLNASFSLRGYSRDAQVVLTAMKIYGLVLADNGSPWYFQGTSDSRWTAALVQQLGQVPASAFQAVDTAPLRISSNSAQAR